MVLFAFSSRDKVGLTWSAQLATLTDDLVWCAIGYSTDEVSPEDAMAGFAPGPPYRFLLSGSDLRDNAIAKVGERGYHKGVAAGWEEFAKHPIPGLTVKWGDGMEDVQKGWDLLASGRAKSNEVLAYVV